MSICRHGTCTGSITCICNGTDDSLNPITGGRTIILTVDPFTDKSGRSGANLTLRGKTEPAAKVVASVLPDRMTVEVFADVSGKWQVRFVKPLSTGDKTLVVMATKEDGIGMVKQPFTVVAGAGLNFTMILIIGVVVALAFGGYVYYKSLQP